MSLLTNLREMIRFSDHIEEGQVFCTDCGNQLVFNRSLFLTTCPACQKSGLYHPELDSDEEPLAIIEEGKKRYYAAVHTLVISED